MYSVNVSWFFTMSVSTFGNLRIEAYLQLPAAYRSLSRPSSAPDAKAFTLCSYSLELPSEFSSAVLFELLEFHWTFVLVFFFAVKRFDPFYVFSFRPVEIFISILGNCSSLPNLIGKTYSNLLLKCVLFYLFVSTHFTSLFGFQWTLSFIGFGLPLKPYFWSFAVPILAAGTACWWAQVDSNHRPRAYQARALTTWAMSPLSYFRCISSLSPYCF